MLCSQEKCTLCGACEAVCPYNAISIATDRLETKVTINKALCTGCNKCKSVCPVLVPVKKQEKTPKAYAAYYNDSQKLKESASGAVFTVLAEKVLQGNGVVYGAKMCEDFVVRIERADSIDALKKLKGSKYVQSYTEKIYKRVKKDLDDGLTVLYSGLPCQIAGLYGFLGKDCERLCTVDIVCHGAPPGKLFTDYISFYETKNQTRLADVQHRYKAKNWSKLIQPTPAYIDKSGSIRVADQSKDIYLAAFSKGYTYRDSCYSCPFAAMPRMADITIGDFFGLGSIYPFKHKCKDGISQVIVNSKKGEILFESVGDKIFKEERTLYECLVFNHNLWKPSFKPPIHDLFMQDASKLSWNELEEKYFKKSFGYKSKAFVRKLIKAILGPNLTSIGMYTAYKISGTAKNAKDISNKLEDI